MKISLCKNNKDYKRTQEFLERNLRKVKFEVKDCISACSECKKKVVILVDGKEISGKDDYAVLKEIKKYLKKNDSLKHLNEENDLKKETPDTEKKDKEKEKDKEKAKAKEKSKDKKGKRKEIKGTIEMTEEGELIVTLPDNTFKYSPDMSIHLASFGDDEPPYSFRPEPKTLKDRVKEKEEEKKQDEKSNFYMTGNEELIIDNNAEAEKEKDR